MNRTTPFTKKQVENLIKDYPTPFYIYDEGGIRRSLRNLVEAFSWNPGFQEYFAVKATPTPGILDIVKQERCGVDCSSLTELIQAQQAGFSGGEIMFTSNDTPPEEYIKARELGAVINLDDITHIEFLQETAGLPELLSFRYNPGSSRMGNSIIGQPEESKFGMTKDQLFESYKIAKQKGVKRFGLHTMVASNELSTEYFVETAEMVFDLVLELKKQGVELEFVNMGGGIGIPYKPNQQEFDLETTSTKIKTLYQKYNLVPLKLAVECGRYITGPHGYLVTKVRHLKNSYKQYAGMDASMADLMRPGMYGAYHHISVLGKESAVPEQHYDLVGSLCENNDKFAIDRQLPELQVDDIVVIHDAGAHGRAMGFNYNGRLRCGEFLFNGQDLKMIRRAETLDDYFATTNL